MTPFAEGKESFFRFIAWTVLFIALTAAGAPAQAEEEVGVAVTVRNEVTGKLQSSVVRVNDGANVFGKEVVKTTADSSAKLVLKDNTNLNVGPNSSVTLDNFVFAGKSDYKQAGFNLAKGAFRFTSGASDKRAYDLKTPVATIGVRGTDFVTVIDDNKTHLEVRNGRTLACATRLRKTEKIERTERRVCSRQEMAENRRKRRPGCECAYVSEGEAVDITENGVTESEFQNLSVGEDPMTFAEATTPPINVPVIAGGLGIVGGIIAGGVVSGHHPPERPPYLPPTDQGVSRN